MRASRAAVKGALAGGIGCIGGEGLGQVGGVERWSAWSFIQRFGETSRIFFFGRRGQIKATYFAILGVLFCFVFLT